jgi:hypothetical protein
MKRSKKITKMTKNQVARLKVEHKRKWLLCTTCTNEVLVDEDVIAVKCPICTCKLAPLEKKLTQTIRKSDNPAGWRFMSEFVDKDGNVFHFGEEQPKLKGTKEPSNVEAIREEQKKKRKESKNKKELRAKMKEERLAKQYEKKMKAKKKEKIKKKEDLDRKFGKTQEQIPTEKASPVKKITKSKNVKKPTKSNAVVRYEKFEESKIAIDRQQIQQLIASEGPFSEHLQRRQINVSSIAKIARSSYAAIDNQSGMVKNRRRGYKVTLDNGNVNIINITVK